MSGRAALLPLRSARDDSAALRQRAVGGHERFLQRQWKRHGQVTGRPTRGWGWGWWSMVFPQQQNFAMGSLAQISSGAIRCSFNTRFRTRLRRVLVQIPPEGSCEDTRWGSRGFCAVPEGSDADTLWGSGSFRCRYSVRFRRVTVQIPEEVPEGLGEDAWWDVVRFRRVPGQIPCEVPEGSGAETQTLWGSGGFWRRRCLVRFRLRRVRVQIPCEVPEGSGADALWNSKGFRCCLMA